MTEFLVGKGAGGPVVLLLLGLDFFDLGGREGGGGGLDELAASGDGAAIVTHCRFYLYGRL